jgi:hydroxypyruvate reductase
LIISDVVGDEASDIASGPCVADPSTFLDAKKVLDRWKVKPPISILNLINKGIDGEIEDTPKPGDLRLEHAKNIIIATAKTSISAALAYSRLHGVNCISMGDAITGEAKDVGEVLAGWAREISLYPDSGLKKPILILSGGECTVTVTGNGRGGRCAEFLLSAALKLESLGVEGVFGIAADTDGIDGVSPHAGVYFDPNSLKKVRNMSIDPNSCLENNDALGVFEPLKQVITTGPTRTNVNDFRALLIL